MSNIIDISKKITNELPMIRISDTQIYSVNNRKNTILNMQAMIQEEERKAKQEDGTFDEMKLMDKALKMLVGAKAAKEIEEMDLPFPEYKIVYQAIMAAATGTDMEEVESRFQ